MAKRHLPACPAMDGDADPWSDRDPRSEWQPTSTFRAPSFAMPKDGRLSCVTVRGRSVMIHDRDLAKFFLEGVWAAHMQNAKGSFQVTVASPDGQG